MSFSHYQEHKESGHNWLGNIPRSWSIGKFRHLFSESSEKIEQEVYGEMLSVSGYRGIEVKQYSDENQKRAEENLVGYRIVHAGQLVVNTMWLNYAGLGISQLEGHVSPAYRCYWVDSSLYKPFVHYLMRSSLYVLGYTKYLTGIRPNSLQMGRDDLMSFPIIIPSLAEQNIIASFLDQETVKIDSLIAEQEKLISLLNEKRLTVISNAVTRGLDPNSKLKNSNVTWLGKVPDHWEVPPLKRLCSLLKDGTHLPPARVDEGIPLLSVRNLQDSTFGLLDDDSFISEESYADLSRSFIPQENDVLLAIVGGTIGKTALVPKDLGSFHIQRSLAIFRTKSNLLPTWLWRTFQSSGFQSLLWEYAGFSAQPGIYLGTLSEFKIPLPPINEQIQILKAIEPELNKINILIEESKKAVSLLIEHRSALISSAVTGQIDVRNYELKEVA